MATMTAAVTPQQEARMRTVRARPPSTPQKSPSFQDQLQSAIWNAGVLANGAQNQAINNNIGLMNQQIGLIGANQKTQSGYINQDAGYSKGRWNLQNEGLGIQQGAIGRASALIPQQHALTMQDLAQQLEQARFGAQRTNEGLSSSATQRGATNSIGYGRDLNAVAKQLGWSEADLGRARKNEDMSFKEKTAQLADQQKQLNLAVKGLGIDAQELQTRTQRALDQLGLSTALSTMDITKAINDANAGRFNPLQNMLGTFYQVAGIRPANG